jgi:hypothetical protein
VILLKGEISGPRKQDGTLIVRHVKGQSPDVTWPVVQSRFKALVYLHSGTNIFSLDFTPSGSRGRRFSSSIRLIFHPMTSCPPVRLVLLIPKDSSYATDDLSEGTTMLSVAMAKFRMAAYLWQAFIAEAMKQTNGSCRTFQLENEWKESTLFSHDFLTNEMRSEAPVYAVTLAKTRRQILAGSPTDILACIETALSSRFTIPKGQKSYFACMLLDAVDEPGKAFSHGGPGSVLKSANLAVYHDAGLAAYPSAIDRVPAAFSDESLSAPCGGGPDPTTTRWRAASHGLGAHLRELARALGLPAQARGAFAAGDACAGLAAAFSLHAAARAPEPRLHPLDAVRLRHHPALRSPFGPLERAVRAGTAPALWAVGEGSLFVGSAAGVVAVEVWAPGDVACRSWMAVADGRGAPRYTLTVSLAEIQKLVASSAPSSSGPENSPSGKPARASPSRPGGPYELRILTADGSTARVVDLEATVRRLTLGPSALPAGLLAAKRPAFKSSPVGLPAAGSFLHTAVFPPARRMLGATVHHWPGRAVAGVEFQFEEAEQNGRLLVGSREAEASKEFALRVGDGEMLVGAEARVAGGEGGRLCGLRLFTSAGRASAWFGDAEGGVEYVSF